ncbi:hypothetical protein Tco_0965721 [Tanacetum coccineum]
METIDTLSSCSNSEEQQMQQIQDKSKESCMVFFRRLYSHLKLLSNNDLAGTRTESGLKRAFATLFGQDVETFTGTMFLNIDQLEKQLDNEEFQEIGSMAAFKVLKTQFQMFIKSRIYLDDEYVVMTRNYFLQYTQLEIPEFRKQSQFLKEKSNEAKVKHDIDVIETINIELEHKVAKLLKENKTLKRQYKKLPDSIKTTRAKTIEHTTSLIAQNVEFKAQLQEKGFAIAALKNELGQLKRNSVNTKFAKPSILRKPVLQPHRNQSVVRQLTAFKFERPRISKTRFSSQVDVHNDLSKLVTAHYLPKERKSAFAKSHHVAKEKTQEQSRNLRLSVMPSARSQSIANDCKPKPRSNTQKSRNWLASKSSFVMTKTVPIADHSRNSSNFSDFKHFVCSTCQKCVFNANHDSCVIKFLNEVNSRAKFPSHKTTNRNKPVEQISVAKKLKKQIPKGHRFLIKKTTTVPMKKITANLDLVLGGNRGYSPVIQTESKRRSTQGNTCKVRYKRRYCSLIPAESDSLPHAHAHAHAQTTKTYYKHRDSRINKAQELKIKTSANSDIKDNSSETKIRGKLLESFQDDAKYEHVGQDTRSQDDKDDKDRRIKI